MMPPQAHTEEEADLLNSFVLSLRARALPAEFLPKERARRELLGETPPPLSGLQAYQAFCSGCHGPQGEGRNYGPLNTRFPAIGAADFLGIAPDSFLEETIKTGRPGRRMPSLGAPGGSLNPVEVSGVVKYLRDLEPAVPAFTEVERATPDRSLGEKTYRTDCAACHGPAGEGTPLGTPLATTDSRTRGKREATYQALVLGVPGTAMPRYRSYDVRTLASLLDYLSTQPSVPGSRAVWRLGSGTAETGEELFSKICAGCHGARGIGKLGPALANPGFQQTAKPDYIAATIMRGRAGTPMPAFGRDSASYPKLTATDVLDVVAFVRGLGGEKKGN
jgi:cytochrome c oxidase cbb3-type subunit 3